MTDTEHDPEIADPKGFEKFVALEKAAMPEPEKTPTDETPVDEEAPKPEKGEAKEDTPPKVDVELLAKSTQALKRYGMTASMVNKLSSEEIIEAGERLLKIQEDNDKAHSELKTLKVKEKPAGGDNTPATPAADVSKLAKRWAEKHGLEESEVAPLLAEFGTEITKGLQARLDAIEARDAQRVIDSALRDVAEQFPDVKDSATKDKLIAKAQQIAGAYDNERDCLLDAARILGLTHKSKVEADSKAAAQAKENGRKQAGLPSVNGRAAPAASRSKDDLQMEAMLAFEEGDREKGNRLMALARAAAAG